MTGTCSGTSRSCSSPGHNHFYSAFQRLLLASGTRTAYFCVWKSSTPTVFQARSNRAGNAVGMEIYASISRLRSSNVHGHISIFGRKANCLQGSRPLSPRKELGGYVSKGSQSRLRYSRLKRQAMGIYYLPHSHHGEPELKA
jgi:hypothetical protein